MCGSAALAVAGQAQSGSGASGATTGTAGIIVKLEDDGVASYRGVISGLTATSPHVTGTARIDHAATAVRAYRAYLAQKHAAFIASAVAAIPAAVVTYRYDVVFGGVAMRLPADQVARVAGLPGVTAVYRDELLKLHTDQSPTFIGAKALWGQLGGQQDAGEGIVVGVLDTGIWPEHPSFSDPDPKGKPYPTPPTVPTECNFTNPTFTCNNKLIGAYRFMAAYDRCVADGACSNAPGDVRSARDSEGHGTHTASTAAGNGPVEAVVFGVDHKTISGIAPRAHVVAYKVCGHDGCLGSDALQAIQQAVTDNVDVINFSIGGGTDPYHDAVELAFRDAYAAGVFVAASAGNEGPDADTVNHRAPWVTTVAASTENRSFLSAITLVSTDKGKLKLTGVSITDGIDSPTPVVVDVADPRCLDATPDGTFAGKIVVCERGTNARLEKSYNVQQRGGVGMILYNNLPDQDVESDNHWVPSVHLTNADGLALLRFVRNHAQVTVAFPAGEAKTDQGDVMGAFSSRGGTAFAFGISKPDVTAPGIQILAGMTPQPAAAPENGPPGEFFQAIAGTSMSSPHIAGSAALLKALHPEWTPGQIKSALMTTASTKKLVKEDGVTPFTAFDAGSGRVDLRAAPAPGLTFDVPASDYANHVNDLWNVNYPSVYIPDTAANVLSIQRTAQSLLPYDTQWKLSVTQDPSGGLAVNVPGAVSLPANGATSFDILIDKTGIPAGEARHATLELKYDTYLVHMPIGAAGPVARPDLIVTNVTAPASGTRGSAMSTSFTIKNQGTATASSFYVQVYLSQNDASLGAADVAYWYCRYDELVANASATCSFSGPVPTSILAGTYYLIVNADDGRAVAESDETNNTAASGPITIN
jgi:subtilisin family serine protease